MSTGEAMPDVFSGEVADATDFTVDASPDGAMGVTIDASVDDGATCVVTHSSQAFSYLPNGADVVDAAAADVQCNTFCNQRIFADACAVTTTDCSVFIADGGDPSNPTIQCEYQHGCLIGAVCGRRPAGLGALPTPRGRDPLGTLFAQMAALEGASVPAFRELGRELVAHRAPRRLVRAAARAERDEVRYHWMMAALARRHGSEVAVASVASRPGESSLEQLATENAVEGCVRETFGALVATWQSRAARDPVVRAAMARIAADETRHAALAWQIAAWAHTRLDFAARTRVTAARRRAVEALVAVSRRELPAAAVEQAGVPTAAQARSLLAEAARSLWSVSVAA